jgi:hypothetical protein
MENVTYILHELLDDSTYIPLVVHHNLITFSDLWSRYSFHSIKQCPKQWHVCPISEMQESAPIKIPNLCPNCGDSVGL